MVTSIAQLAFDPIHAACVFWYIHSRSTRLPRRWLLRRLGEHSYQSDLDLRLLVIEGIEYRAYDMNMMQ